MQTEGAGTSDGERELRLLKTLLWTISEAKDFTTALQAMVETICRETSWECGGAWGPTLDGDAIERLPVWYAKSEAFDGLRPSARSLRLHRGEGMPGRAWERQAPEWADVDEVVAKRLATPRLAEVRTAGIVVAFSLPIFSGDKLLALLEFAATARRPEDVRLFEIIDACARQLSSMLERKRLGFENQSLAAAILDLHEAVHLMTPFDDPSGWRTVYANNAYARMFGYSTVEQAMATKDLRSHWGPKTVVSHENLRAIAQGRPVTSALTLYRLDGTEVDVEYSCTPIVDAAGNNILTAVVMQDAGAKRRTETMAALGSLVAGVAHEVRNPLFGIGATLDALQARMGERNEYAPHLQVLRGELARLSTLMNDLLDYGRPPGLDLHATNLVEVCDAALTRCQPAAERREVRLVHLDGGAERPVPADHGRLVQVMINLVDNAIAHSPSNAAVTVRHASTPSEALIAVEDEGPGIPSDDLPRLFEPFFTKRHGGTGLGLSIVQRIVEQHGGHVGVENRREGGARLTVHLPIP
jgi:PAS domain S-box-containing protein